MSFTPKLIIDKQVTWCRPYKGKLYYADMSNSIRRCNLDGSNDEELYKYGSGATDIIMGYDDWIYFTDISRSMTLAKIKIDGTGWKTLTDRAIARDKAIAGDYIYFSNPPYNTWRVKKDGSEFSPLFSSSGLTLSNHSAGYIPPYLFYVNPDGQRKVIKMDIRNHNVEQFLTSDIVETIGDRVFFARSESQGRLFSYKQDKTDLRSYGSLQAIIDIAGDSNEGKVVFNGVGSDNKYHLGLANVDGSNVEDLGKIQVQHNTLGMYGKDIAYSSKFDYKPYVITLNEAPNKPVISTINSLQPSVDISNPLTIGLDMNLSWTYQDPDSDPQSQVQVRVVGYDNSPLLDMVYDQSTQTKSITGVLKPVTKYKIQIRVKDTADNWSEWSDTVYIQAGNIPNKPEIYLIDNTRIEPDRAIEFIIGSDVEDTPQHFKLNAIEYNFNDSTRQYELSGNTIDLDSSQNQSGWEVYDGSNWIAMPSGGAKQSVYSKGRFVVTGALRNKKYECRLTPIDVEYNVDGHESDPISFRCGRILEFSLVEPETNKMPEQMIGIYEGTKHHSGVVATIHVSNNAADASPTWEDATTEFLTDQIFTFTNKTKTAANWQLGVKCKLDVSELVQDEVYINMIGGSIK